MIETKSTGGTSTYKPYPVCGTNLGYHRLCVSAKCCGGKRAQEGNSGGPSTGKAPYQGELLKYGIGIALFFKFIVRFFARNSA